MVVCQFCKKNFERKSSLNNHQKTVKSCLQIQERNNVKIDKRLFSCDFCKKELSSKARIKSHVAICKKNPGNYTSVNASNDITSNDTTSNDISGENEHENDTVKTLKKEVDNLKKEVEKLKQKEPSITINNTIDNSVVNNNYGSIINHITPERISSIFGDYKISDLLESSQKKIANIVYSKCLSGKDSPYYICTDRSRHKFVYTDVENEETEDPNAVILRNLVYAGMSPIFTKLYKKELKKLKDELARVERLDIDSVIQEARYDIKELEEAYRKHNIIKNGDEYVSELSKILPTSLTDRIKKDQTHLLIYDDKDVEDDLAKFNLQFRKIGGYTLSELEKYKDNYKKNKTVKGPAAIIDDVEYKEEFIKFLENDDY
jgi:hypothetical protein